MVEKLLGVRLHAYDGGDYPPCSEWLSVIQCKYYHIYTKGGVHAPACRLGDVAAGEN